MTYAPDDLLVVRAAIATWTGLPAVALGIVGDTAHAGGYHCGADRIVSGDYSAVESSRDWMGLTMAASALDVGEFSTDGPGGPITLRSLSVAIADGILSGDPRLSDVREIIYSPHGSHVVRVDRLGIRSDGDDSHLTHTHLSFFRDSEGRRAESNGFLGLISDIFDGKVDDVTPEQAKQLGDAAYTLTHVPVVDADGNATSGTQPAHNALAGIASTATRTLRAVEAAGTRTTPTIDYRQLAEALLDAMAARRSS